MQNLAIGTVDFGDFQPTVGSVPVAQGASILEVTAACTIHLGKAPDSILIVENRLEHPVVTNTYIRGKHYG